MSKFICTPLSFFWSNRKPLYKMSQKIYGTLPKNGFTRTTSHPLKIYIIFVFDYSNMYTFPLDVFGVSQNSPISIFF